MTRLTVAIDAMGWDYGPSVTVPAALQALSFHLQLILLLVGDPDIISTFLVKANFAILGRMQVISAESVIASDAKPLQVIRNSHGSSMRVALELLKEGKAKACVSAGNTGALISLAKLLLKLLEGIERPALMAILPHQQDGETVLLDLGVNVDSDNEMLVQFATMGAVIAEEVIEIDHPRVALLNIGQEETKGLEKIRSAASLLRESPQINYIGFLEGNDFFTRKTDVLVCDGFVANVILKTIEGMIRIFLTQMKSPE